MKHKRIPTPKDVAEAAREAIFNDDDPVPSLVELEAHMEESVRLGYAKHVGYNDKGQRLYELTPKGKAHVEAIGLRHLGLFDSLEGEK